jgi:hypothetical protein
MVNSKDYATLPVTDPTLNWHEVQSPGCPPWRPCFPSSRATTSTKFTKVSRCDSKSPDLLDSMAYPQAHASFGSFDHPAATKSGNGSIPSGDARRHQRIKPDVPVFSARKKEGYLPTAQQTGPHVSIHTATNDSEDFGQPSGAFSPFPIFYAPVFVPIAAVYGPLRPEEACALPALYASPPSAQHNLPIMIIPYMAKTFNSTPSSYPPTPTTAATMSGASDINPGDLPIAILIERNAFKPWFENNTPKIMQVSTFRFKRYKSVETFAHWLSSRKKYETLEVNILIKITEINRLLLEVKSVKHLRIFAYEHLVDPLQQPTRNVRKKFSEADCQRKDFDLQRLLVSTCLEQACRNLVTFHQQSTLVSAN